MVVVSLGFSNESASNDKAGGDHRNGYCPKNLTRLLYRCGKLTEADLCHMGDWVGASTPWCFFVSLCFLRLLHIIDRDPLACSPDFF